MVCALFGPYNWGRTPAKNSKKQRPAITTFIAFEICEAFAFEMESNSIIRSSASHGQRKTGRPNSRYANPPILARSAPVRFFLVAVAFPRRVLGRLPGRARNARDRLAPFSFYFELRQVASKYTHTLHYEKIIIDRLICKKITMKCTHM